MTGEKAVGILLPMKAIVIGDIEAACLVGELEEDKERRSRGMELLSIEVPEDFFWRLTSHLEEEGGGSRTIIKVLTEYMDNHPV